MIAFLQQQAQRFGFQYAVQRIDAVGDALRAQGDRYAAAILSAEEQQRFSRPVVHKRKLEWLAGRIAAKRALAGYAGIIDWPQGARHFSVLNDDAGAPFFSEYPELTLSLSHSHDYAVAVIAHDAIGIDIEKVEPRPMALAHYFCCAQERGFIEQESGRLDRLDVDLTLLWCRKEAVAKYLRLGGRLAFAQINVLDDDLSLPDLCARRIRLLSAERDGYAIALALPGGERQAGEPTP
jgi:4'-phosphopantetheinyl transferase EntD